MSAEIASLERVRDAVETIRKRNDKPTADAVIAVIGGGSKKTVLSHMRALRETHMQDEEVPPAVMEMARTSLAEIYRAGGKAEIDRSRLLTERLSAILEEQEAQIDELAAENARCLQLIPELTKQRDDAIADRLRVEGRLAEAVVVQRTLEGDLAAERTRRSESIEEVIARIEAALASAARGAGPVPSGKHTISLPKRA